MGGREIDVPTGAIVSSTPTVVVHTPEKSLCDAERDAVVTTTPLVRCSYNDHSEAVWMTTRSTRTLQNA